MKNYSIGIIGGGFFGMYLAEYFARLGKSTILIEKESDYMQRASYINQARVHNGYHYPRSILTALRSRISFPRFCQEFSNCIDTSFESYYMIGRILGKVTAKQFKQFCDRIGAPCEPAPPSIVNLTNPNLIEAVFETTEYAFDAVKLKNTMETRIHQAGVEVRLNTMARSIRKTDTKLLEVILSPNDSPENTDRVSIGHVFNCTYSMINFLLTESGIEMIPLKHELTEMCLVEVPDFLKNIGLTVMCGPFFSIMPFPARRLHSFSHVRYTPHYEWTDDAGSRYSNAYLRYDSIPKASAWNKMIHDGCRYIPSLCDCKYHESLWEVKTVLPRSETDDSRPILFKKNYGLNGFHCIMGGKIDNVYDVIKYIEMVGLDQ